MSGFGILVSLAFSTMIILHFFGYFLTMTENAVILAEIARKNRSSLISFEADIEFVSANVMTAKVTNDGPRDIPCRNLKNADIIVVYFDRQAVRKIAHITYLENGEEKGWLVTDVTFGNASEEILDPVIVGPALEGVWNIGETLQISIILDEYVNQSFPILAKLVVVS